MTWFKSLELYDPYRNDWKAAVRKKHTRPQTGGVKPCKALNQEKKEIVCAMFVPPSRGSKLLNNILLVEEELERDMDWKVKIIEQSGIPLVMSFIPSFPLEVGCPTGADCNICGGSGMNCGKKGTIYKATCSWCNRDDVEINSNNTLQVPLSAGEEEKSERPVGMDGMNKSPSGGVMTVLLVWII